MEQEEMTKRQKGALDLYFWLQALVIALVSLMLIFTFIGRVIGVDGESMMPTLHDKDMLLLQSIGYTPEQGDVVVLRKQFANVKGPIVKRVIATEGQIVDIDFATGTVYVDGVALDEPYLYSGTYRQEGVKFPLTVDEGCVFVMGDNRMDSKDSRSPEIGLIDEREILGKVIFLMIPGTGSSDQPIDFDLSRIGVVE